MDEVLQVGARVVVGDAVEHPVTSGWGPVFFHAGKHHAARIRPGTPPIAPGDEGGIILYVISSALANHGMRPGETFELRDGPHRVIATGSVEWAEVVQSQPTATLA